MARQDLTERMVPAQPVQFLPLEASDPMISGLARQAEYSKLELILDVPLQFVVELGRTEKTLQEILELGPGSVISLEKLAGESLDILVNGKFIAKGEVIVIDENYGVRIKEILNQEDRLGSIKNRA
jgi:flagellar motor switch protein FliN/FliY